MFLDTNEVNVLIYKKRSLENNQMLGNLRKIELQITQGSKKTRNEFHCSSAKYFGGKKQINKQAALTKYRKLGGL